MNFLDIEITKKMYIKILVVLAVITVIFLAFTMSSLLVFKSYKLGENTIVDDEKIKTGIYILEHDSKKIEIAGYAYEEGKESEKINTNFVLKNHETEKMYLMRTKMEPNRQISDDLYYKSKLENKDFEKIEKPEHYMSGLHAQCLLLGIPKGTYDIYVLYQNDDENILKFTLISVEI